MRVGVSSLLFKTMKVGHVPYPRFWIDSKLKFMERHRFLKYIARSIYMLPGLKLAVRELVRFAVQCLPLSLQNKQRLYNFFAKDTAPAQAITCRTPVSYGRSVELELSLQDDL